MNVKIIKSDIQLFLCILLLCIPSCLSGHNFPHRFLRITNAEGLASNTIHSIFKDNEGFIWFGTSSGLNRFDGVNVKNYKEFSSESVSFVTELNNDILLIGMEPGLKLFNKKKRSLVDISLDTRPIIVRSIHVIDKDRFLVATEQGLYYVCNNGSKVQKIILDKNISLTNAATSILAESSFIFWITTQEGLCRYDLERNSTTVFNNSKSNYFTSLTQIGSTMYLGTYNNGIFSFSQKTKEFKQIPFSKDWYVKCVAKDNANNIYIGTDGNGLKIWNPITNEQNSINASFKEAFNISSNTILSILIDNSILWMGTHIGGVNYNPIENRLFKLYMGVSGDVSSSVRSFLIYDHDETKKLIGTRDGLIYISEKENIVKQFLYGKTPLLRAGIITHIFQYNDKILVGTFGGGLYFFNLRDLSLSNFSAESVFIHGSIFRIEKDKQGNLWIATDNGLYSFDRNFNLIRTYNVKNSGLASNTILNIICDSNNCIWITALNSGVSLLDVNTGIIKSNIFPEKYGQILNKVYQFYEDSQKNIWISTNKGLFKVQQSLDITKHYSTENILPDNTVRGVIEDSKGNLWITTLKGIVCLNTKNATSKTYDVTDGLASYNFNNIISKSKNGTIWWSNDDGLLYCNPLDIDRKTQSNNFQKPTITSILVNDKEFISSPSAEYLEEIVLENDQNNIGLKFSLLSYSDPKFTKYEYRLDGQDSNNIWTTSKSNSISYFNLKSGKYVFQIRNPENHQVETLLTIKIKRSYTFLLYSLITIIVIGCLMFLVFARLKKKNVKTIFYITKGENKYTDSKLGQEESESLQNRLLIYMETQKPYLRNNLKIGDLANEIGVLVGDLSTLLNIHMSVNFTDFVNSYRVNVFVKLMSEKDVVKYTMTALSQQCGFNSRTTFYRAFKKIMGKSPLEYAKELEINFKKE